VFDGLAAGLATIVFAEAIHGTNLRDGEHVIVAEKDDGALGRAVGFLLENPLQARALAAAGRRFACACHDWRAIARELESVLTEFVRPASAQA
jgi:glycosyltransferase involved in cell wall biosynthesis